MRTAALGALYTAAVFFAFLSNFWFPALALSAMSLGAWVALMLDPGPVPTDQD